MSFDKAKLFSSKEMHERTINTCGESFPVFVRRLPVIDKRRYVAELMAENIEVRSRAGFDALHKAIRNADGTPFATADEFSRMEADAIKAFMKVFEEVNASAADGDLGNA